MICIPFTTNQKELASLYRLANVLVITSVGETYPTVCLEAQVCGTPVVGFDVGGVAETIQEGMGVAVPKGNVAMLREAVYQWTKVDKSNLKDTGLNCIRLFDRERMSKEYLKVYKQMKGENP